MNEPWRVISYHLLSSRSTAQDIYDALFKAALNYKFRGSKSLAYQVDSKILTDAIFDLQVQDKLRIGHRVVDGQKIKELFITSIFLKRLERQFKPDDHLFVVLPEQETSCDTAIMIAKAGSKITAINTNQLKLPAEHYPFLFQIKEYFDFERMTNGEPLTPREIDVAKIIELAKNYSESTLIFLRDLSHYQSERLAGFFKDHPNTYLISATDDVEVYGKKIDLPPDKHNYVISYPGETMSIENFDRPRFLLSDEQLQKVLRGK